MSMDTLPRTQIDQAQAGPRPPSDPATEPRRIGEYRILRRLGEGGMGAVYLAYHEGTDHQVAIKVLSDQLSSNQSFVDRFHREAKSGALLNHPSIVRSLGAGQDKATRKHYLVLEYVDGPNALGLLEQYGKLPVGDAVHIALDVARALEHAHSRNIIHRDIKPDNILVTRSGVSKLVDLGLARRTDEVSHLTAARQGFGTPYYMPYEQAVNARHADGRSDIYALGATLYHLLTGEVPFKGENPLEVVEAKEQGLFVPASQLNPTVPRVLDRILDRMLAHRPEDRYQTASDLIVDLERSRLAAAVPSYADPELAMKDPWVRACMASVVQPTQPDLAQMGSIDTPLPAQGEARPQKWLVRFLGLDGRWCRTRLSAEKIARKLRAGTLPPDAEVCSNPREGFIALSAHAVFADPLVEARLRLVAQSEPRETPSPAQPRVHHMEALFQSSRSPWWPVYLAGLLALLFGALSVLLLLFLQSAG
jgi:serine/threonine-protein kinase